MVSFKWVIPLLLLSAAYGCKDAPLEGGKANPHVAHNVVSLSPGTTELALSSLTSNLLGRTASDDYPPNAKTAPVMMSGTKPDYEAIAAAHPDAILYDPALFSPTDLDKFKQMKVTLLPIGGNSLQEFVASLYAAGSAMGQETPVNDYVQTQIYQKLHGEQSDLTGKSYTVAMLLPGKGAEHMIAGTNTFQADIIRQLGSKPVGPDAKAFVNLNVEDFLKENPDVILVAGDLNSVARDPRLANMKAIKHGNIFGLNQDEALREGSRVDQFIQDVGSAIGSAR